MLVGKRSGGAELCTHSQRHRRRIRGGLWNSQEERVSIRKAKASNSTEKAAKRRKVMGSVDVISQG